MPLDMEIGLGLGHIVLDGDPAPPLKAAQQPPLLHLRTQPASDRGLCLLWLNGWMDQDAIWYRGRSRLRRYCVRWETQLLHGKGHSSPQFSTHFARWPISPTAELLFIM